MCKRDDLHYYDAGVSSELARYRKESISDPEYSIDFRIPADRNKPVEGISVISFSLLKNIKPLLIDFREEKDKIREVLVNNDISDWEFYNEHIIIPKKNLSPGINNIQIKYHAGDLSLNRKDDFLYTLFVPDRACTAFPCFDQPDLKAEFSLTLQIDSSWRAISNSPETENTISGNNRKITFSKSKPISTYLFCFAAGKFKEIELGRSSLGSLKNYEKALKNELNTVRQRVKELESTKK